MGVDNRILNKSKSQEGASITFALLIFLICGVLSSVIIVAATASSGRMSDTAKTDQKYYAVTSAAELLKDEIDGAEATIERRIKKVDGETKEDVSTVVITKGDKTKTDPFEIKPEAMKNSFVADAVYRLVETSHYAPHSEFSRTFQMTLNDSGISPVQIKETISHNSDNTILFEINNTRETDSGGYVKDPLSYKMNVLFDVDVSKEDTVTTYEDDETNTKKIMTITTVTFHYRDLK